jgi:glycosyltransferase involved in cell wall biosynthesis
MSNTIVYPPTINWSMLYQRPQFILEELVKNGFDCIFYDSNPPFDGAEKCDEPYNPCKGVTVVPPDYPVSEIGDFNLYYSFAHHHHWIKDYKPEKVIYDNLDWPTDKRWVRKMKQSVAQADMTLAVSDCLLNYNKKYGKEPALYVPNGVDYDFFTSVDNRSCFRCPEPILDMIDDDKKIIGFTGVFWEHVTDWPLFLKIAESFPEVMFVMTGSFFNNYDGVPDNMKFFGHVDRNILPAIMSTFDVGVIPFLQNKFTQAMCPLKFYEYMASGINTVTTPIPEVDKLKLDGHVLVGDTHEEFISHIEYLLKVGTLDKDVEDRKKLAKEYDWGNVLKPFIEEAIQILR